MTPYDRYNHSPKGVARRVRHRATKAAIALTRVNNALWRRRNPDKKNAHGRLAYAVQTGRVTKLACEMCGSEHRVQAHHPFGYAGALALAVWWLCQWHHSQMHRFMSGAQ